MMHKVYTFKNNCYDMDKQIFKYLLLIGVSYFITIFLVNYLIAYGINIYVSKFITVCFVYIYGYFFGKFFVFRIIEE